MAILTREAILGAQDLKRQEVKVPEWGGSVIVTELTAARRIELIQALPDDGSDRVWTIMVVFCCVDEAGDPLFTLKELEALEGKNGKVLAKLGKLAYRMNKLGREEGEALEENFTRSQS